ncbi:permease [alpha proteobacterium AAP81b]|nr:permease [alpha proteobacterium AAP81b]
MDRLPAAALTAAAAAWGIAVAWGASDGVFAALPRPLIAAIVAVTIAVPTAAFLASPRLLAVASALGQRRIIAFHLWRIPAALLFFWLGLQGALPPLFWILAGTGDLVAGLLAGWTIRRPVTRDAALAFHRFGFADFVVAVGTGLSFTLLNDPRMAPVAMLPLALVVLYGVGISGVSHLVSFRLLRR